MGLPVSERRRCSVGRTASRSLYRLAFIGNCHRWLAAAYATLDPSLFSKAQEPAITGELVRAMKEVKLRATAPTWMIRMYVADDPPVNAPGRLGKQRRRVDIEFERSERGAVFCLCFEAKRLYRSDSTSEYLGDEGLGMFLRGEYARDEDTGAMLGYVQKESVDTWVSRLRAALDASLDLYQVTSEGQFAAALLIPEFPQTHRSVHLRPSVGRPILVYHTFLLFTSE